jgi:hypothetical protein
MIINEQSEGEEEEQENLADLSLDTIIYDVNAIDLDGSTAGSEEEIEAWMLTAIAHLKSLRSYQNRSSSAIKETAEAISSFNHFKIYEELTVLLSFSNFLSFQVHSSINLSIS